jgi:hypothetical protein
MASISLSRACSWGNLHVPVRRPQTVFDAVERSEGAFLFARVERLMTDYPRASGSTHSVREPSKICTARWQPRQDLLDVGFDHHIGPCGHLGGRHNPRTLY